MIKQSIDKFDFLSDIHVVGGAVRDSLLSRESDDIDLATSDCPETVIAKCESRGMKTIKTGISHGTVTAIVGGEDFEITTFRRDVATDGRNATVEFAKTIEEDLGRRDFTINAMAVGEGEVLKDPFGGIEDLINQRIRCVGEPRQRFQEDFLRIIRAVRFSARYSFRIGEDEREAMADLSEDVMENVSVERLTTEMKKAFKDDNPRRFINNAHFQTVLSDALGAEINTLFSQDRLILFLRAIAEETGLSPEKISKRLRLPNGTEKKLSRLLLATAKASSVETDVDERKFLAEFSEISNLLRDAFGLDFRSDIPTDPIVRGRDLISIGMDEGPQIGEAIEKAHQIQLEEKITNKQTLIDRVIS